MWVGSREVLQAIGTRFPSVLLWESSMPGNVVALLTMNGWLLSAPMAKVFFDSVTGVAHVERKSSLLTQAANEKWTLL